MIGRIALAMLLLAGAQAQASAPVFELRPALPPAQAQASSELLEHAVQRLPPAMLPALARPIAVEWRDDLPAGVHGRARHWHLQFDHGLLDGWMARDRGASDDPGARAALATVVHELAHLYDRTPAGRLSADPRLLDLAGWQVAPLRAGRRGRNDFRDRSPDPYELHSPREYVAVNLEHYLLDPEYRCRRPLLAALFDAHLRQPATDAAGCGTGLVFVQDAMDGGDPVRLLDPERIFAIDYLLAEGDAEPMSRWGHAMLRLVVCAPGRPHGPDCRLDLQHHLVLSFRAFVDDLQISGWAGLTGSYPSRLFALPLAQVVDEYARVELRDLRALPLALSHAEIAAVATRAAQLHWSYDGRYFFISNNCAVETWKLLHDAVPRLAALPLRSVTPEGLLRRLQRHAVVDTAAIPGDAAEQVRLGFHFESASAHHEAMYAVARQALALAPADARAWMALAPERRMPALGQAGLRAAAALLVLESAAMRREHARARDELKRRWLRRARASGNATDADIAGPLHDYLQRAGAFSRPAVWLDGIPGYGLPQARERNVLLARAGAEAQRRVADAQALEVALEQRLSPARRQALAGTRANLELLGERLRRLAQDAGQPAPP